MASELLHIRSMKSFHRIYLGIGFDRTGEPIDFDGLRQEILDTQAASLLGGGFTRFASYGCWQDGQGKLVREPGLVYESYCTLAQAEGFAKWAKHYLRQACVLLVQVNALAREI